jgi:hypothetical protein
LFSFRSGGGCGFGGGFHARGGVTGKFFRIRGAKMQRGVCQLA